jgi:pimeloyl-ACP methyl ester carboxylesterase
MSTATYTLPTSFGDVPVTLTEGGQGSPILLLHGGAGPDSVAGFAGLLAARRPFRTLTPVNPGFGGTPRPAQLDSVRKLAEVYRQLLDRLELTDVTVLGSSIGGWAAAELALTGTGRVGRIILVDPAGLDSAEHPVADFFSLTLDQVFDLSYANPDAYRIDVSTLTDAQRAVAAGNRAALESYAGRSMADPGLAARLAGITVPALVVWGEADRMVTPAYGKEYAAAIPGAEFHILPGTGHLPQIETPEALLALVERFTSKAPKRPQTEGT